MLSAYLNENPEQGIIDACKDIFGPMFFRHHEPSGYGLFQAVSQGKH